MFQLLELSRDCMLAQSGRRRYITRKIAAVVRAGAILVMREQKIWKNRLDLTRLCFLSTCMPFSLPEWNVS